MNGDGRTRGIGMLVAAISIALVQASASGALLVDTALTSTTQIRSASNNPYFGAGNTVNLGAVNISYNTPVEAATLNGIGFHDLNLQTNPISGTGIALAGGLRGTTMDFHFGGTSDMPGSRNLVWTNLTGTDAAVGNQVSLGNRYISTSNHRPNILTINGAQANQPVYVQLIGGQHNWNGPTSIYVNGDGVTEGSGTLVGAWNSNKTTYTPGLAGFEATADASGKVTVEVQSTHYSGWAAAIVQAEQAPPPPLAAPPAVTSANLSAHFNASNINNDGGASTPGDGNDVNAWTDLVGGMTLNHNFPIDGKGTFIAAGSGGIGNQDTVRFNATAGGGDLMFNNAMGFNAQTVFAVVSMVDNASGGLSTLMSNQYAGLNIRQTTADAASYFSGNSGDFVIHESNASNGGTVNIDGSRQLDIPGGFGAAHLITAERTAATTFNGFRLSDNVTPNRRWNGDIAEILVYDAKLSRDDTLAVQQYIADKYGLVIAPPPPVLPAITSANLSAHFDAGNVNNDGGVTNPGDGGNLDSWTDLVTGNALVKGPNGPQWLAAGSGGINNRPTARFDSSNAELLFNNSLSPTAQTIFAVATVNSDGVVYNNLIADQYNLSGIRQNADTDGYYPGHGDAADFVHNYSTAAGGGTYNINGNWRTSIPGAPGTAHVLRVERTSPMTYNGFRMSENSHARYWNGDIAEILVFDATLSGDDTLLVQTYLTDKYAIGFNTALNDRINESKQIAVNPFGDGSQRHAAVNFHYGNAPAGGTFKGIGFDDINLGAAGALTGTFPLSANAETAGATLTLNFPFTSDNSPRTQNANIANEDSPTLNTVANEFFYIGGGAHPSARMTFAGLAADTDTFVQVLGGDANWVSDVQVLVNGAQTIDWLYAADNGTTVGTASLLGFYTTTDASGRLQLDFTIASGNYAGIGGIFVTQELPPDEIPEPATMALIGLALAGLGGYVRKRRRA